MISNGAFVVLVVNVLGTAIAGAVGFREQTSKSHRLFWITGFAGGFTTFSSLSFFLVELPLVESALLAGLTLVLSLSLLAAMGKR